MIEFITNPNTVYLLMIAGLLLSILAILTPGTGALEISAIVIILVIGWSIRYLRINYWAIWVLIAGAVMFFLAVRKPKKRIVLGISLLAFILGTTFLLRGAAWWLPAVHPTLTLIVSPLTAAVLWFLAVKVLDAETQLPYHDLREVSGAVGVTKTRVHEEGTVYVMGELWSARSEHPLTAGTPVRVLRREGFVLVVEALKDNPPQKT